ncbi:MAG: hypothetical protein IJX85_06660 [Lachnospiraceae bacterium]|nr:hypothetical protein [Lachnospiraceae bacterium]
MIEVIMGFGTNVHILWCIGLLGLLSKLLVNLHMKSLIKASENMATTRRRALRIMKQKFVNGRNLGINRGDGAAFVEKNVRRLKWAGLPLEFWKRSGWVFSLASIMTMAGSFVYYETRWRGSQEMVTYLAHGVIVCAFLLTVENIFLVNNKLEILKANIRDYFENLSLPEPREKVNLRDRFKNDEGNEISQVTREVAASKETLTPKTSEPEDVPQSKTIDNERMLDSFLKEFFS